MELPQEFIIRNVVHVIQLFGQNLIEMIPVGETILAERPSEYKRMVEMVWEQRRYLIFERDLLERAEPLGRKEEEDPPKLMLAG